MSETMIERKIYLGDSVYARFDDFGVNLTTENGKPDDPSNEIFLEFPVLAALNMTVERWRQARAEAEAGQL